MKKEYLEVAAADILTLEDSWALNMAKGTVTVTMQSLSMRTREAK
jgi:hypothetical protein